MSYLDTWEQSVKSRPGVYTDAEKKRMLLSTETLLGIRRTGNVSVLCSIKINWFITCLYISFSEKFCRVG